jgi:ribosomal-protein-alanine N-acetyltransferase
LVAGSVPFMHALNEDRAMFGNLIGSTVPDGWPEFPEAVGSPWSTSRTRRSRTARGPCSSSSDSATGHLVGSGGFATPPVDRTVEIGYEVAPEFRGRGFGAAAARAMIELAVAGGEVDAVIAHTLPGSNASTGVLVSWGFERVADQQDPEVGVVWKWRWTRPFVE